LTLRSSRLSSLSLSRLLGTLSLLNNDRRNLHLLDRSTVSELLQERIEDQTDSSTTGLGDHLARVLHQFKLRREKDGNGTNHNRKQEDIVLLKLGDNRLLYLLLATKDLHKGIVGLQDRLTLGETGTGWEDRRINLRLSSRAILDRDTQ
jgi:hypothetical protein